MAASSGGSLLGSASTWPLKRYGRFLPPTDSDEEQTASSWQVFESNEESGHLILTIVVSGHFFISQGRTVLNECRMFRVQFGGDSKQQMLEHCCSCVQKLAEYVPVQVTDEQSQNLCHSLSGGSQVEDAEQVLHVPDEPLPDSYTSLGERRSVTQLAQVKRKNKSNLDPVTESLMHREKALSYAVNIW
ncbi:meiotic recombination protein REC114 isoform X4 [Oxyura jamaicensis]|uniref:meiotic recombination protein REC114 isoform X4 n=1 Tax=Oxyura jamaicensis TaxID=8884 RepID=UPI0015A6DE8F|nr:meiotic recombination protein REC114 isoform X4 [Oxyura jamaicensis]